MSEHEKPPALTELYALAQRAVENTRPSTAGERLALELLDGLRPWAQAERAVLAAERENPFPGQVLGTADLASVNYPATPCELGTPLETSNVVTSRSSVDEDGTVWHKPVLDIDFPVRVAPSSTPGHFHLFLDREMTGDQFFELIDALNSADVLQSGYVEASMQRGFTAVRLPWIKKAPAKVSLVKAPSTDDPFAMAAGAEARAEAA